MTAQEAYDMALTLMFKEPMEVAAELIRLHDKAFSAGMKEAVRLNNE